LPREPCRELQQPGAVVVGEPAQRVGGRGAVAGVELRLRLQLQHGRLCLRRGGAGGGEFPLACAGIATQLGQMRQRQCLQHRRCGAPTAALEQLLRLCVAAVEQREHAVGKVCFGLFTAAQLARQTPPPQHLPRPRRAAEQPVQCAEQQRQHHERQHQAANLYPPVAPGNQHVARLTRDQAGRQHAEHGRQQQP
jgi:hypothetical protein